MKGTVIKRVAGISILLFSPLFAGPAEPVNDLIDILIHNRNPEVVDLLRQRLNLSDVELEEIQSLQQKYAAELNQCMADRRSIMHALRNELTNQSVDKDQIHTLLEDLKPSNIDLQVVRLKQRRDLFSIIGRQRMDQLDSMRDNRRQSARSYYQNYRAILLQEINMTNEQRNNIEQVFDRADNQRNALRQKMQGLQTEIRNIATEEPFDESRARGKFEILFDLLNEYHIERIEIRLQIEEILSDEQRQQWTRLKLDSRR